MAEWMSAVGAHADAAAHASEAVSMFAALADTSSEQAIRARLVLGEALSSLHRDHEAQDQFALALAAARAASPPSTLLARVQHDLSHGDDAVNSRATDVNPIAVVTRPAAEMTIRAAASRP